VFIRAPPYWFAHLEGIAFSGVKFDKGVFFMSAKTSAPTVRTSPRSKIDTRKLVTLAMLSAIAYVVMWVCKGLPSVMGFMDFDFKHVVICIGGFLYGPSAAACMTLVVAFIEMITVGSSQVFGFIMNVLGTASFCCTASFVYQRMRTKRGAVLGLALGMCTTIAVMLLWNYFMIPLYMEGITREAVVGLMLPTILPFNLAKSGMNAGATLLLYKPVVTTLRRANLVPPSESGEQGGKFSAGFLLFSVVVLATFVMLALVLLKIL